jgi:hypothetical protein
MLDDNTLLKNAGWVAECLSPLELRHTESGSFATGLAAKYVLDALREEAAEATTPRSANNSAAGQLAERIQTLLDWVRTADRIDSEEHWQQTYDLVFSKPMSQTIASLRAELGISFDYYDPNTSYQEDVRAYSGACAELAFRLKDNFSEFEPVK